MNFTQDILFVFLIGLIADKTNTDLATNQSFLFLLLMILNLNSQVNQQRCCCNQNNNATNTLIGNSLFPNQF